MKTELAEYDKQFGIFGTDSGGLDPNITSDLDAVQMHLTPQGVVVQFACPGCKRNQNVQISYPEIVSLSQGVAPHLIGVGDVWSYDPNEQAFFPNGSRCGSCNSDMPLLVTTQEASQITQKAAQGGAIPPQVLQGVMARVNQAKASGR